jgi:hypothetical protein
VVLWDVACPDVDGCWGRQRTGLGQRHGIVTTRNVCRGAYLSRWSSFGLADDLSRGRRTSERPDTDLARVLVVDTNRSLSEDGTSVTCEDTR